MKPHALVVGGTGMLAEAVSGLAGRGYQVSVLARRPERLSSTNINPIALDYRDSKKLRAGLAEAVSKFGPISLAVVWIHGTAPEAPYIVAEYVQGRYFHVLGSAFADPNRLDDERQKRFAQFEHTDYREVILGFVIEQAGARWLTNGEISEGVLKAIRTDARRFIVGVVEPWSARP